MSMQSLSEQNLLVKSESRFIHKCSFCEQQIMELSEGDIIYGSNWYHKPCWDIFENESQKLIQKNNSDESICSKCGIVFPTCDEFLHSNTCIKAKNV